MDISELKSKIVLDSKSIITKNKLCLKIISNKYEFNNDFIKIPVIGYSILNSNKTKDMCLIRSNTGNYILVEKINGFYIDVEEKDNQTFGYLSFKPMNYEFKDNIIDKLRVLFPINSILSFYQWNSKSKEWKPILSLSKNERILNITTSLNNLVKCSNQNNFKLEYQVNKLLEAI